MRLGARGGAARELGVAALSGGLLVLAFPRFDFWLLAFVVLAPWLARVPEQSPRLAALTGLVAGLAFFAGSLWWITDTMVRYGDAPAGLRFPVAVTVVLTLATYLSLYVAAFAALLSWLRPASAPAFVLAAAGLWVALEYLRTHLLSGFPWNLLGYSQYQTFAILPLAALTGVYGLSFLVLAVNAALAWAVRQWGRWDEAAQALAVGGGLIVLALAPGWSAPAVTPPGSGLPIALLQGNIAQELKWDPARLPETVATYQRLSQEAAATGPALIVWPETAVPFSLEADGRREAVLTVARVVERPLVVGAPHVDRATNQVHNSAFLVDAAGAVSARYDKRHLVPFGEYVPLRRLLFFADWFVSGGIGEFAAGRSPGLFASPVGRLAITICYEAIFPAEVRRAFADGADLLVNITNDAWFGRTSAPYQHLAMAALRAVENGAYVVRAANTGISAIVAPDGRILHASGLFTREVVTGVVAPRSRTTFYTRYGDVFALGTLLVMGVVLLAAGWARRRPGLAWAA